MNIIEKSESIRAGLRVRFRDGTSKMARRRCYGYGTDSNGDLVINPDEAAVVHWIFECYLSGDSLGKIAVELGAQGIPSPTGKPKWNREAINKLISNEKYIGRVLLQKTVSTGGAQIKNDGFMDRYLYSDSHEAIISDELFKAVQEEKMRRSNTPEFGERVPLFELFYRKVGLVISGKPCNMWFSAFSYYDAAFPKQSKHKTNISTPSGYLDTAFR